MAKTIKIAGFFCLILLCALGFNDYSYAKTKVLLPKVYQHLDIGVQLAYSGSDWDGRGLAPGSDHDFETSISLPSEIKVIGAYALPGNESEFDFYDKNSCSHNIPPGCDFSTHYAPYSAQISSISANSSGNTIYWKYRAKLMSFQKLEVVGIVKKYHSMPNGIELAKREIYTPLGGESFVCARYPAIYAAISDAIRQAASIDLGNNELTLFYAPIVFKYQKYEEVEDLYADLDAPSSVKKGSSYVLKDISRIDSHLTLIDGVLEKQISGKWHEIVRWNGNGLPGVNTGGTIEQIAENIGSDVYRFTIRTTSGQEASCIKTVVVTDGRDIEGKAVLVAPKQSYEGHPFKVYDRSEFTVDGRHVSATYAYSEGLAENYYEAFSGTVDEDGINANVTFFKRGVYPVTLRVRLKSGGDLFDTKNVEVLKTPYADVKIGGVQKQNRKQTFNAHIATCPRKPITAYELEIVDLTTGETARFNERNLKYEGNCIKTRNLKLEQQNEYFSNLTLEFLTKYPNFFETGNEEREFSYFLKVEDSKGDTDIQRGKFCVCPDLPPDVNIDMQDAFMRGQKSDLATIVAEDITKSDGDLFERTWMYADGENPSIQDFEALENQKDYKNISIGTNQKISFQKEGVGKFKIKLHIKEKWQEETLEEFITSDEYLQGETNEMADVINIAPKVSITPIESIPADLVIVGDEESIKKAEKKENRLQSELIERGIDANISWVSMRKMEHNADYYKKMAEFKYTTGSYNTFCDSVYMLCDENHVYTASSSTGYSNKGSLVAQKPYQLIANSAFTGEKDWSFTVNEENCTAHADKSGRYILISCNNSGKTIILSAKSGQYIGKIPIKVAADVQVYSGKDGNSLYFVGESGITAYNIIGNSLKRITANAAYVSKFQNGKMVFIEKKGQMQFYHCNFDLETEELLSTPYPNFEGRIKNMNIENTYVYLSLIPVAMDVNGNAVFSGEKYVGDKEGYVYSAWYANLKSMKLNKLKLELIDEYTKIFDVGGIENERGEFKDCYSLKVDYSDNGSSNRGEYTMSVVKFYGKDYEIYREDDSSDCEDTYMLLARKDTKNGRYNFIKQANISAWEYIYSKEVSAKSRSYSRVSPVFAREIMSSPEKYEEQNDFEIFGSDFTGNFEDKKTIRTYLPVANDEDRLFRILKSKATLRSGVDRYVITLDESSGALIENVLQNIDKKVCHLEGADMSNAAEKLEESMQKSVGMLLIKAKSQAQNAKVSKVVNLDSNGRYSYEYILYKNADKAEDVFSIHRTGSAQSGGTHKQIIEKQDFRLPYKNGFVKFEGKMLKDCSYAENAGFGSVAERWNNTSFSLEFTMEKAGYLECDFFVALPYTGRYYIMDLDENLEKEEIFGTVSEHKVFSLSRGKHVLKFIGISSEWRACEIGLRNLEIGYYVYNNDSIYSREIKKLGNGKFMVKGTFDSPKLPLGNGVTGRYVPMRLELSNNDNEDIKISNFRLIGNNPGQTEVEEIEFEEFSDREESDDWDFIGNKNYVPLIVKSKRQAEEMVGEIVYKKGQLVRYKINYEDYENDPSKKQCFLYIHTPYNDGEHPSAYAIRNLNGYIKKIRGESPNQLNKAQLVELAQKTGNYIYDKPIERFYIDGKYTVYHWQEDDTTRGKIEGGNPDYDKQSNICEITFYVEGTANAPWVKSIATIPRKVQAGRPFELEITVDDLEKENLNLITEVYKKGERVFVHNKSGIVPYTNGVYPTINTGIVTSKAQIGLYTVVCTVSDATSVGISKYSFVVSDFKSIKGNVMHTKTWDMNRQRYNAKIAGKEFNGKTNLHDYLKQSKPRARAANVFWAGEKFVLQSEVGGKAEEVECKIAGTGYLIKLDKTSVSGDKAIFSGSIWEESMKKDWAGKGPIELTFVFTARYDDGEVKQFEEKVIIDDSEEFRKLHRTW
ncbi:MAG: hypothetical protein ACTTH0_04680 [Eubacteriales bacterium]